MKLLRIMVPGESVKDVEVNENQSVREAISTAFSDTDTSEVLKDATVKLGGKKVDVDTKVGNDKEEVTLLSVLPKIRGGN